MRQVEIGGEKYATLTFAGCSYSEEVGYPQLPVYTQVIELPLCADVKLEIEEGAVASLCRLEGGEVLLPAQAPQRKSDTTQHDIVKEMGCYGENSLWQLPTVSLRHIGVARSRNLYVLTYSPIRYNPVSGEIAYTKEATVIVTPKDIDHEGTERMKAKASPMYDLAPNSLNEIGAAKVGESTQPVRYLIISADMFEGELDSFVAWKKRQGYQTEVRYTSEFRNSRREIAEYIKGLYDSADATHPAPTYVLLVGDEAQIDAFETREESFSSYDGHPTDLYYFTWTNDNIPDCYYGRFSAQTVAQLRAIVEKVLLYEQYGFEDDSFLSRAVLIAGEDRGARGDNGYNYADPAMDYAAANYVNATHGYNTVYYYKNDANSAPDGVTVTGNCSLTSSATAIRGYFNEGIGWGNYSAHGNEDRWATPAFTVNQVQRMTNTGKAGVMIGNCCLSNKFSEPTCFGEALLRKANAGATAYIGATDYTYWTQDFYWSSGVCLSTAPSYNSEKPGMYDLLFHTHSEMPEKWMTTMGAIMAAGNMAVQQGSSYMADYYWEVYTLMGDPSMQPYLGRARTISRRMPEYLVAGIDNLTLEMPTNAYIALIDSEGEPVMAMVAGAEGTTTLPLDRLAAGAYTVAITTQGYKPYFGSFSLLDAEEARVALADFRPTVAYAGDTIAFSFSVKNISSEGIDTLRIELRGNPAMSQPLHDYIDLYGLQPGESREIHDACAIAIKPEVSDGTLLPVDIQMMVDGEAREYRKTIEVRAAALCVQQGEVSGNYGEGDTVTVALSIANTGRCAAHQVTMQIAHRYGIAEVIGGTTTIGEIAAGGSAEATLRFVCGQAAMPEQIAFDATVVWDKGRIAETLIVAQERKSEDFASGDLSTQNWVNDASHPWYVTDDEAYSGRYSVRSYAFGTTGGNASSTLTLEDNAPYDDTISFYYLVSSEANYDIFTFAIDGVEKLNASDTGNVWTHFAAPVRAGRHTYTFSYSKDYSVNRGKDAAFVDHIQLPTRTMKAHYGIVRHCGGDTTAEGNSTGVSIDTINGQLYYTRHEEVPSPVVTIAASNTTLYFGQKVTLVAQGADRYEWSTGDTTASITLTPEESCRISVTGYRDACEGEAAIDLVLHDVGIEQAAAQSTAAAYPNPTTGKVRVRMAHLVRVSLYDIAGRCIGQKESHGDECEIDLSTLPQGIYIAHMTSNARTETVKIVKR